MTNLKCPLGRVEAFRLGFARPEALGLRWPNRSSIAKVIVRLALCAGCFLSLCNPVPAAARDDDPQNVAGNAGNLSQLNLEQLGNVEVTTVSKGPERVQQTPAAIFVITQEDIRRSGATSIPEALRLAPGVDVARIDADHWSISIRGFAGGFSKNLLVLIDGRSVYTPLFSGVYWDVQNVLLEDIDRIEVIRGPGGTIWGANAVNGVINIITKSSKDTQGALMAVGGGGVNEGTGDFRFGGSVGGDFNYRVYGMGSVLAPESHPDGDNFDRWRMGQAGFRSDWKEGEKDSFTLQGDIYRGESGERVDIATFPSPSELASETFPDDYAQVSGGNLLARWEHNGGGRSDIQVQAYFDRTNRQDLELGETRSTFDIDFLQHLRTYKTQELTWGLGARVSPDHFIQSSEGVNFLPNRQTDTIYSGFLQYELPIVQDRLTLTAGTKLEYNNFSHFEYQPSVRLLWSPTSRQSFWAAVTRAVRTPSRLDTDVVFDIFDEYYPVGTSPQAGALPVFFMIEGNPEMKSEQLIGYELGYRAQVNRNVYVDFTPFYNSYRNLQGYGPASIGEAPLPTPPPLPQSQVYLYFLVPYANVVEGYTAGAEIAPDWKITPWWEVRGSYSFLHVALRDNPGFTDTGNLLGPYNGSNPRDVVNFQSFFNLPKRFEIDGTYRFSSALPAQNVSAYSTADLRLGWHLGEHLEFSVIGQNLFQPYHAEFGGDPNTLVGIQRSAYGKITWRQEPR